MKVYRSIDDFQKLDSAVVTSGTFDGVHLGHRKILTNLVDKARKTNSESVVITFWPHPRTVLQPDQPTRLLTSLEEKIELIGESRPDHLIILPFSRDFSNQSSLEFIYKILIGQIGTKYLIIGYDHRFGKNREGSFEFLKENAAQFGFEVEEIPREDIHNVTISSTNIRKSLQQGDLNEVLTLLGRPYFLTGTVVHGEKIGRKLGFPTANIQPDETLKLIPCDGVYAIEAEWQDKKYPGMMNIGYRPTVGGLSHVIEAHLFDFNEKIYEDRLRIYFRYYIRPEKRFSSLEELKSQLQTDRLSALDLLKS